MDRTWRWFLPAMAAALLVSWSCPVFADEQPKTGSTTAVSPASTEAPAAVKPESAPAPAPESSVAPAVPASSPASAAPAASQASAAPEAKKLLTLEECIRAALGQHPRIKGAEQDYVAGQYVTKQAISSFWPQIGFEGSRNYSHSARVVRIGGEAINTSANIVANNLSFNTNWMLFDFGRTYYKVKSLAQLEDSLLGTLTGTQQQVAYDIMDAYYNLLKNQKLVKVSQETLDDANAHLKQAQAFFEVGTKPKYDVTQAEVQVDNAKVSLIQAEDAVKSARFNLNTKIGIDPQTPTEVEDRPNLEEMNKPLEGYYDEALKNRPEIQSLDAQVRSGQMNVKGAIAGYFPQLSAQATVNWYKEDHSDFLTNENAQLTLDIPIFNGFLTNAQIGQARANLLSTKYRLEDQKLTVLSDVSQAYLAVQDAKARFVALDAAVKSAKENLDIATGRYEAGVGAIIDVTDAQVSLTTAETNLATAFYDYHSAFSRLLRSTGKEVK
jgi:outer membrane protein